MSLLADLLSKIKQPETKLEIPPNLKNIMHDSAQKSAQYKKIFFLSGLFVLSVLAGLFLVYFIKSLTKTPTDSIRVTPPERVARVVAPGKEMETAIDARPESEASDSDKKKEQKIAVSPPSPGVDKKLPKEPAAEQLPLPETMGMKEHESTPGSPLPSTEKETAELRGRKDDFSELSEEHLSKDALSGGIQLPVYETKRINTSVIDGYLYTAREYEKKKDYSKALTAYKKVLEIEKHNFSVSNSIAYIYLQLGLLEESIKYSQRALDTNSFYVPSLINLAIAHAKSGNTAEAKKYLNQAVNFEPDNHIVLLNLAILNERQKNYAAASEYYSRLIKLGDLEGSLGLARVYENQDKTEDAIKLYRSVYDLEALDESVRLHIRQRISLLLNKSKGTEANN